MKKISSLLLSALLVMTLIVPVSAAGKTVTISGGDDFGMADVTLTNVVGQGEIAVKEYVWGLSDQPELVDSTLYVYQIAPTGGTITVTLTGPEYGMLFPGGAGFYKAKDSTFWPYQEETGYEGQMFGIGQVGASKTLNIPLEGIPKEDIGGLQISYGFDVYFTCNPNLKFLNAEPAGNPFTDVPADAYYHDPVLWALENGITNGTSPTTFGPTETCTRGQVATFLWRAKGCPEPTTTVNPFKDVKESDYFYKPVLWAVEQGITKGTSATTFDPNETCTSAHVITFLWRANGMPAAETSGTQYYSKAVAWGNANGLLAGTAVPFAPTNLSPRADIVTYLYRDAK